MMKLVLFVTVITMNSVHCLTNFREKAELVDRRFDLWVTSSLYAPSVLNCARKCESSGSCLSFQFSSGSAKCRLLDTVVLHRDAGISEVGWKYYVASNRMYFLGRCKLCVTPNPHTLSLYMYICFFSAQYIRYTSNNT